MLAVAFKLKSKLKSLSSKEFSPSLRKVCTDTFVCYGWLKALSQAWATQIRGYKIVGLTSTLACALVAGPSAYSQTPTITNQPQNVSVTAGESVTFRVSAVNATGYFWMRDSVPIPNSNQPSYTLTANVTDGNHAYSVVVIGPNNQQAYSSSAWLFVAPKVDIPTVNNVEFFGTATAQKVQDSFGLGVDSNQDWEFAAAASIGAKWVRADGCQWEYVEIQNIQDNTSGGFAPGSATYCNSQVQSASRYNLHLDALSYFAPPHSRIASVVISDDVAAGSTTLPFTLVSGNLSSYSARNLLLFEANGPNALRDRIDYGTPIDDISNNTFSLPEPSLKPIAKGTVLTVQALLYPPVLIAPSSSPTAYLGNTSVQAWTRYIGAIQNYMSSQGVTGSVELWNEPEQPNELWDHAPSYYQNAPSHFEMDGSGRYLAFAAATLPLVPTIRLLNGWSNGSGSQAMFAPNTIGSLPVTPEQLTKVYGDALHPYGNNPEQMTWLPEVIKADAMLGQENPITETPIGGQVGANFKSVAFFDSLPSSLGGTTISITETGAQSDVVPNETEVQRTRFDVRQFITYASLNVSPIIFFKAATAQGWNWFDDSHNPYPVALAFRALMSDINSIGNAPATQYSNNELPQVSSYAGYYPLATGAIVGAKAGGNANSILFYTWQKTYVVPSSGGNNEDGAGTPSWFLLQSPSSVTLHLRIPSDKDVQFVKDVVTGQSVSYLVQGDDLSYPVSDNPIEVMLVPTSKISPTLTVQAAAITYGTSSVALTATLGYSAGLAPTNSPTFTINGGSPIQSSCVASSSTTEQCSVSYPTGNLSSGYYSINVDLASNAIYSETTSSNTLTITLAQSSISITGTSASLNADSVILRAVVTSNGSAAITGGLTFSIGVGSPVVSAQCTAGAGVTTCTASYPLSNLIAGSWSIAANFLGDKNNQPAASIGTLTLTPATASLTVNPVTASVGASAVSIQVVASYTSKIAPSGNVSVSIGGGTLVAASCATISSSLHCFAQYPINSLAPQDYVITVFMAADTRFASAAAAGVLTLSSTSPSNRLWVGNADGTLNLITTSSINVKHAISSGASALAADSTGSVWAIDASHRSLSRFSSQGETLLSGFTGAGLTYGSALAVDGANAAWIANQNGVLSAVSTNGSAISTTSIMNLPASPTAMLVDSGGSVWITNSSDDSITEVIGIATPVLPKQVN